ncbi:MAG: cbb3-type cytochrome c oxidase subunit 3 [Thiotrichaceae bacterium]
MDILVIFQSVWTVVVMVLFLGIAWWAYSSSNKATFDEAARIPLEDDDSIAHDAHKHD